MRLVNFKVAALHGYLDIDIPFMKDLTFLIGTNGSGKTSVLRLISAMTNCDLIELSVIKFKHSELKVENNDGEIAIISYAKNDEQISVEYNKGGEKTTDTFAVLSDKYLGELPFQPDKEEIDRATSLIQSQFRELPTTHKIQTSYRIVFLGISRYVDYPLPLLRRSMIRVRVSNKKDISIDDALDNIRDAFFDRIRRNAEKQQTYAETLKSEILRTCFHYEEANLYEEQLGRVISSDFLDELKEKEKTLMRGVELLGDEKVIEECKKYFEEIIHAVNYYNDIKEDESKVKERFDFLTKLIVNSVTLDKYDKIIELSEEYNNKIKGLRQPFSRFENGINKFFEETGKKVSIDGRGRIKIMYNGEIHDNLHHLSSGEKQIVAIFADMALNANGYVPIMLIDEPDLSLHIAWQENLVEALQIVNPDVQYVLATHSPSIISRLEWRDNVVDLTNVK